MSGYRSSGWISGKASMTSVANGAPRWAAGMLPTEGTPQARELALQIASAGHFGVSGTKRTRGRPKKSTNYLAMASGNADLKEMEKLKQVVAARTGADVEQIPDVWAI